MLASTLDVSIDLGNRCRPKSNHRIDKYDYYYQHRHESIYTRSRRRDHESSREADYVFRHDGGDADSDCTVLALE
jgi:hypothetical protein